MTLDELLAPLSVEAFRTRHLGRAPLHLPSQGSGQRRAMLDWRGFNRLLSQTDHWTASTLRLLQDREAVAPSEYCREVRFAGETLLRPSPARVEVFLSSGASLVANEVQTLHGPISETATALSREFAAHVGANVYCSFQGVQAFGPHYDPHDVFAVQTEGEKVWRIYETQLDRPVDLPADDGDVRGWLERVRGPLAFEVTMRPGDVLYLPRGRFHDAVAVDSASLHVTYSVTPLHGGSLMGLIQNAAMQVPAFRDYLPASDPEDGAALQRHLRALGTILADLITSPSFLQEVKMAQERLVPRPADFSLPHRKPLTNYRRGSGRFPAAAPDVQIAFEWCAARDRFSLEDLIAQFDFIAPAVLREAIEAA